jgi:hypothetical protein
MHEEYIPYGYARSFIDPRLHRKIMNMLFLDRKRRFNFIEVIYVLLNPDESICTRDGIFVKKARLEESRKTRRDRRSGLDNGLGPKSRVIVVNHDAARKSPSGKIADLMADREYFFASFRFLAIFRVMKLKPQPSSAL